MALLTEEQQGHLVSAMAKTVGKTTDEIEAILAGDKPTEVDKLLTDRIRVIRSEADGKGKTSLQVKAAKLAKEEFGVESQAETIEALMADIKESYKPAFDASTLTEEAIKTHPTFKKLETDLMGKDAELKTAVDAARAEARAEINQLQLDTIAERSLAEFGAVLPESGRIRKAQLYLYKQELAGVTRKEVDGKVEFYRGDKRIENDKGFPLSEAEFFKGLVEANFDTRVSEQIDSPGAGKNKPAGGGNAATFKEFKGTPPKTQEDADKIFTDYSLSNEAVKEVQAYWQTNKPA